MIVELTKFIPWISAIAAVLCGVCGWRREWRWLAGPICVAGVVMGFALTLTRCRRSARARRSTSC